MLPGERQGRALLWWPYKLPLCAAGARVAAVALCAAGARVAAVALRAAGARVLLWYGRRFGLWAHNHEASPFTPLLKGSVLVSSGQSQHLATSSF